MLAIVAAVLFLIALVFELGGIVIGPLGAGVRHRRVAVPGVAAGWSGPQPPLRRPSLIALWPAVLPSRRNERPRSLVAVVAPIPVRGRRIWALVVRASWQQAVSGHRHGDSPQRASGHVAGPVRSGTQPGVGHCQC
jgi:hypothetical protein